MIIDPVICPHPFTLAVIREHGQSRSQRSFVRYAVRAVVQRKGKFLMVHSSTAGDYKFPGGGVNPGERHGQALAREVREETGRLLKQVITLLGVAIELDLPQEDQAGIFRMVSFYYLCSLKKGCLPLELDPYEIDLGFTPLWVTPSNALQQNERLGQLNGNFQPFWLAREIAVLRALEPMLGMTDTHSKN